MRISEFKDPFTGRKGIYLFTTDHLERSLLFRDEADFVQGSNTIALATLKYPVKVLCYALMDNHIHLLLLGRYTDCLAFFAWVLHRIARMLDVEGRTLLVRTNNFQVFTFYEVDVQSSHTFMTITREVQVAIGTEGREHLVA